MDLNDLMKQGAKKVEVKKKGESKAQKILDYLKNAGQTAAVPLKEIAEMLGEDEDSTKKLIYPLRKGDKPKVIVTKVGEELYYTAVTNENKEILKKLRLM